MVLVPTRIFTMYADGGGEEKKEGEIRASDRSVYMGRLLLMSYSDACMSPA
jgi:hypothetical protein